MKTVHRKHHYLLALLVLFVLFQAGPVAAKLFYIDKENGSNANDGLTPASAWKNPDALKLVRLAAEDSILFHTGMVWHGYTISFDTRNLKLGNYGEGSVSPTLPVISAAAPLSYERIFNSDLDVHVSKSSGENTLFPGWEVSGKSTGSIHASIQTRNKNGVCANIVSSHSARLPRIGNTTSSRVAAGMPLRYIFWAKIIKGKVDVRIRNLVSKKYLGADMRWSIDPVTALSISKTNYIDWTRMNIDFNNDALSQIKIEFIVNGNALIDDMHFVTSWVQDGGNIFKRTAITSSDGAVYGVYIDDQRVDRAGDIKSIGPEKRWYWDTKEKVLYLFRSGDLATLQNDEILVDRSHYKLINLGGDGQEVDGLAFEKSTQGIRVSANNITIKNSIIRQMSSYSIMMTAPISGQSLNNITISSNRISDSGNGPYLVRTNHSRIDHNIIFDIGNKGSKTDMEAIPVMVGNNNLIEYNEIHDVWLGIDLWGSRDKKGTANQTFNNIIRYNKVYNASKYAIVLGGEALNISLMEGNFGKDCPYKKVRSGCAFRGYVYDNLVHHNLVYSSGNGYPEGSGIRITKTPIRSKNYAFNNSLYDNKFNVSGESSAGGFVLANNISLMPRTAHLSFPATDFKRGDLQSSRLLNNIYYPGDSKSAKGELAKSAYLFNWASRQYSKFSRFKPVNNQKTDIGWSVDPLLRCVECGDFRPGPGSPAIGKGTRDIGLSTQDTSNPWSLDIGGHSIPASMSPDIGAFQFIDGSQ